MVTVFHIISNIKSIKRVSIQAPSGKWYPVKAIRALSAINDLAVLEVEGYKSKYSYSLDHSMDSVTEVETAGFPYGTFQYSKGQILPIHLREGNVYTQKSLSLGPGASGSPVFKGDKLIAIKKGSNRNFSIGTAVDSLRQLLSKPSLHCQAGRCIENEMKKLHKLANKGDKLAQFRLGYCYERGTGLKRNIKKAFELYTLAAEQGQPEAQYILASCILTEKE